MPMLSGRDALTRIDEALGDEQRRVEEVDRRIEEVSSQLLQLGRARVEDLRDLIKGTLARLCTKGTRAVRMMWITRVCDNKDSTNQPV